MLYSQVSNSWKQFSIKFVLEPKCYILSISVFTLNCTHFHSMDNLGIEAIFTSTTKKQEPQLHKYFPTVLCSEIYMGLVICRHSLHASKFVVLRYSKFGIQYYPTPQHLVNLIPICQCYKLFELVIHVWCFAIHARLDFDCEGLRVPIFIVTLMLVHVSSKKLCL